MMRSAWLLVLPLAAQDTPLPNRCGCQIQWKRTLDEGLADAKKQNRLVLWYVPIVDKSPMDKKTALDAYTRGALLTDPDVVEFVGEHFVAVASEAKGGPARRLDIVPLKFIEPGFAILDSEGNRVHLIDRISTFSPEFILHVFREALKKGGHPVDVKAEEAALRDKKEALPLANFLRRMGRPAEALRALADAKGDQAATVRGLCQIRLGRWEEARKTLEPVNGLEAKYWLAAAYYFLKLEDKAVTTWKEVATSADSPWAWRAAMELSDDGPIRHAFFPMRALPEDAYTELPASTDRPRDEKKIPPLAVEFLLDHQRSSGAWLDSRYDFGGNDSLPNVYTAVTALCAAALLDWRDVDPKRVEAALGKADAFLVEESNLNPKDTDEYIWGLIYRLLYFSKRLPDQPKLKAKMAAIVKIVLREQDRRGVWHHEYLNPFCTASVVHALKVAKDAGLDVPDGAMERAAVALKTCRDSDGSFSYHYPPQDFFIEGSAGRMPLCELAMVIGGESSAKRLQKSIDAFFEHNKRLQRVRKYDNHADEYHNGGFFFWYDFHSASEAMRTLEDPARKDALSKLKEIVVSIPEIDGSFVDSHELGKCYGTAMGLLTLKNCLR